MNVVTLEDLKLAIRKNEDLSEKLAKAPIPEELIDFDALTVEEFFSLGLTLYWKAQTKGVYEQGYFWKTDNNGLQAIVGFAHSPDGLFITALGGTEGLM